MTTFHDQTAEDIYLEYVNDFLTIEAMADYYDVPDYEVYNKVETGRQIYNEKFE